jgi:hypothetical protein
MADLRLLRGKQRSLNFISQSTILVDPAVSKWGGAASFLGKTVLVIIHIKILAVMIVVIFSANEFVICFSSLGRMVVSSSLLHLVSCSSTSAFSTFVVVACFASVEALVVGSFLSHLLPCHYTGSRARRNIHSLLICHFHEIT